MKVNNVLKTVVFAFAISASFIASAQVKVGDNPTTMNANAVLEVESTNKGFLPPRVALTSTTSAAPLAAHVQGMVVFNTATANDVVPALYVNDGTKWIKAVASVTSNNTNIVSLEVGQTASYYSGPIAASSWANSALLSNISPSNPPISFEGIRLDVAKADVNYWVPRIYNTSATSAVTFSFVADANVDNYVAGIKTTLPAGTANYKDWDGLVYWINNANGETEIVDIIINDKWYRATYFGYQVDNNHYIRTILTRLQ